MADVPSRKKVLKKHKKFVEDTGSKVITASKVKAYFKSIGIRADANMTDAVAATVYEAMKKAALRVLRNGRKTVRPWDL